MSTASERSLGWLLNAVHPKKQSFRRTSGVKERKNKTNADVTELRSLGQNRYCNLHS
jgi:hypothetical protein